jgi:ubiquinone/menaquinone biosynthesis C-methylase UbiE
MAKQVENAHYWTEVYLCKERFLQYGAQFISLLNLDPSSILEIGPGPGLLSAMLKRFCKKVTTLDFADDTGADIVSDIKSMPLESSSYDIVCAFQVLEHMPWADVKIALIEMSRVSRQYVIFSVPDNEFMKKTICSLGIQLLNMGVGISYKKRRYKGISNIKEHYWEIGVASVSLDTINTIIKSSNLELVKQWLDGEAHHFLCKKV